MTILETVIAATLISVAIVASLRLSTNSQKETSYARNLSLATKYNYQSVDWLKNVRNELGWANFAGQIEAEGGSVLYCLNYLPDDPADFTGLTASSKEACSGSILTSPEGSFYRTVTLTLDNPNSVQIFAVTYWPGSVEHSVTAETSLTNY